MVSDKAWWNDNYSNEINYWNEVHKQITHKIYSIVQTENYIDCFVGFYWTFELYTQDLKNEEIWADFINYEINVIEKLSTNIPLLMSPFYSNLYILGEDDEYDMWVNFFRECKLREIDIFAPQDGYGRGGIDSDLVIDSIVNQHLKASYLACEEFSKAKFYVNIELFTRFSNVYASSDRIEHQKELAIANNAEGLISFSYSHYYI